MIEFNIGNGHYAFSIGHRSKRPGTPDVETIAFDIDAQKEDNSVCIDVPVESVPDIIRALVATLHYNEIPKEVPEEYIEI